MKRILIGTALALSIPLSPTAHADNLYVAGTSVTPATAGQIDLSWAGLGTAQSVPYPASLINMGASVQTGTNNLDSMIKAATGPTQVVGVSQGDIVIANEKQALMNDPNRPAANQLSFVQIADPTSPTGIMGRNPGLYIPGINISSVATVDTPYNSEVIIRRYDGVSDWPADQTNLLADMNAVAGMAYLHPNYGNLDLSTAEKTVTTNSLGGVTTTYRVPTDTLPLLQPLLNAGVPKPIVQVINAVLKPMVDAGYRSPRSTVSATTIRVRKNKHHDQLLATR